MWNLSARGAGFGAFEGKRVWMSAIEGNLSAGGNHYSLVVSVSTTVRGGAFALECIHGLSTNYAYPAAALLLDTDGSGDCSVGDLQLLEQRYGWAADLDFAAYYPTQTGIATLGPDRLTALDAKQTSIDGGAFCQSFFPH